MLKNILKEKQGMENRTERNKNRSIEETRKIANTKSRLKFNHINNF